MNDRSDGIPKNERSTSKTAKAEQVRKKRLQLIEFGLSEFKHRVKVTEIDRPINCAVCDRRKPVPPRSQSIHGRDFSKLIDRLEQLFEIGAGEPDSVRDLYMATWFDAMDYTCTYRTLLGTFNSIIFALFRFGYPPEQIRHVFDELWEDRLSLPNWFVSAIGVEDPEEKLEASLRFWIDAARKYDEAIESQKQVEVACAPLAASNLYLGWAAPQLLLTQLGRAAAQKQFGKVHEEHASIKAWAFNELNKFKDRSMDSVKDVILKLTAHQGAPLPKSTPSTDVVRTLENLLQRFYRDDQLFTTEVDRIVKSKRGRPRVQSKIKSRPE